MGQATAWKFAQNGDMVYIIGRRKDELEKTAKKYPTIFPVVGDVTKLSDMQKAYSVITKKSSAIDVLVSNAGGVPRERPENSTLEENLQLWNSIITINLTGAYNFIAAFKPSLASPGGRIIFVSSLAGLNGSQQGGVVGEAYAAAKAGLHGMVYTMARTMGVDGITVNAIAPGLIDQTDFFPNGKAPDKVKDTYMPLIPLKRLGTSDEIAAGIEFLASKDASYITGEIMNINGGALYGR